MPRLDPQARRQASTVEVTLAGGDTILCRRKTLMTLVLCGIVPLRLLRAGQNFIERYQTNDLGEIAEALSDPENAEVIEAIDRYICAVAIEPQIVMSDDGDPTHQVVTDLEFDERIAIFNAATAPALVSTPVAEPVLPDLSTEVARADFRTSAATVPADAASAREDVQPTPELVAHGRVVEKVDQ